MAVSQAFIFHFKCYSILYFAVCQLLCWAFLSSFLATTDNQFGFKKGLSCSHAIYSIRSVIDEYVDAESTVNVCALDLYKAFDRMNHFALFITLMNRNTPVNLLAIFR